MSINETLEVFSNLLSNPGFVAIATAAITTMGVKLIEGKNRGKEIKVDESTSLRIELRAEIDKLRIQLNQKEIDIEKWRERYYALQEKYNEALNRERVAMSDLQDAREELNKLKPPNGQD
jgi:chromosome segregation ATPase